MVKLENTGKTNPRVIVTDMDETLVNITPKWFSIILDNIEDHYDLIRPFSPLQLETLKKYPLIISFRPDYMLSEYFEIIDGIDKDEARKELNERFLKYLEDENFYDDLEPTLFAKSMDVAAILPDKLEKIIVLTHSYNEVTDIAKKKFMEKNFNNPKFEMVTLRLGESKIDYLNSIAWGTFIDDSYKVIDEVLHNDVAMGHEIIVPGFAYNADYFNTNREHINEIISERSTKLIIMSKVLPISDMEKLDELKEEFGIEDITELAGKINELESEVQV